jgi:ubiquinone/menaquinone biosynthesis C-methylase UbiE
MPTHLTPLDRLAYTASQAARFGWFYSQYRRAQRRVEPAARGNEIPQGMPSTAALLAALFDLFRRDLRNIEAGLYALPPDMWPRPDRVLAMNRRFFRDLLAVDARRRQRDGGEVFRQARDSRPPLPRYFLQNFHYQSDGYLSEESAALYDYQVEILFSGGADAMRRQALVPLARWLAGPPVGRMRMLDVGCGTGRFTRFVRGAHPLLPVTGVDLSAPYVRKARRDARHGARLSYLVTNGERLPFADASFDIVSDVFLFHELPPRVRSTVACEIARVLRPGGLVIHLDTIQRGDVPRFDPLLDLFPMAYHEPYFASYVSSDLGGLFGESGLTARSHEPAFLSKVSVFEKPA